MWKITIETNTGNKSKHTGVQERDKARQVWNQTDVRNTRTKTANKTRCAKTGGERVKPSVNLSNKWQQMCRQAEAAHVKGGRSRQARGKGGEGGREGKGDRRAGIDSSQAPLIHHMSCGRCSSSPRRNSAFAGHK